MLWSHSEIENINLSSSHPAKYLSHVRDIKQISIELRSLLLPGVSWTWRGHSLSQVLSVAQISPALSTYQT